MLHHKSMPDEYVHAPFGWNVANASERANLQVGAGDVGRLLKQQDDGSVWELVSTNPVKWASWMRVVDGTLSPDAAGAVPRLQRSRFSSAIAAYKAGYRTRPPIALYIADSNGTGEGAGSGGAVPKLNGAYAKSPWQQTADVLASRGGLGGLPVRKTAIMGEGNSGANSIAVSDYNPMITLGSGWTRSGSPGPIGGQFFISATTTDYLTLNLGGPVDTVEVHFPQNTATLSTSVGVYASDNTQLGTFTNRNASAGVAKITVSSSKLRDGVIKVRNLDGAGSAYVTGVIGWDSTEKAVIMVQGTRSAGTTDDFANPSQAWNGIAHLATIQPDATMVALTINDINAGTATATYNTNLTKIGAEADKTGDVGFAASAPGSGANYLNSVWTNIEAEVYKVARSFGAAVINMHREIVSWAAGNADGLYFDANHGTAKQYGLIARLYADWLQALVKS